MTTTGAPADLAEKFLPNRVRPSQVIIVGARMTEDVLSMVQDVEEWLVEAVRTEAVAVERRDIAAKLRANEALLNEFAKDGSVAGLIAFLIESLTVAASDSPPGAVGLGLVPPEGPNPAESSAPSA